MTFFQTKQGSFWKQKSQNFWSVTINARAFLELLFLWDEDFDDFDDGDFEGFFFLFESSESSSLYFFFLDSFSQRGQSDT